MQSVPAILRELGVKHAKQVTVTAAETAPSVGSSPTAIQMSKAAPKGYYAANCIGKSIHVSKDEALALVQAGARTKSAELQVTGSVS